MSVPREDSKLDDELEFTEKPNHRKNAEDDR